MIENTSNKTIMNGDGSNYYWPYTFDISTDDGSDIDVYIIDSTNAGGTGPITTGYLVDVENKRVVYPYPTSGTKVPLGSKVVLIRKVPLTQETQFSNQGNFNAAILEPAFDKVTMALQQIDEKTSRVLLAPVTITKIDYTLPEPEPLKAFGWNATGDGIVNYDNPAIAAANAAQSADDAADSAAQASESLANMDINTIIHTPGSGMPNEANVEAIANTVPLRDAAGRLTGDINGNAATANNADTVNNKHADDTPNNIPLYDANKVISGGATATTRFQVSGAIGVTSLPIPAASDKIVQIIGVTIPNGKSLKLKMARYSLDNTFVHLAVTANKADSNTWVSTGFNGEEMVDYTITTNTGSTFTYSIYIKVHNALGSDPSTITLGNGWWCEFEIE